MKRDGWALEYYLPNSGSEDEDYIAAANLRDLRYLYFKSTT